MFIIYILTGILTLLITCGLIWGLGHPDRILQYPFLASIIWIVFLLPMVFQIVNNMKYFSIHVIRNHGVEGAIIMGILCVIMGWLGFAFGRKSKPILTPNISIERLFYAGCILYILSTIGMYKLLEQCGGLMNAMFGGGYYSNAKAGSIVIWNFLSRFAYPAFLMIYWSTLRKSSKIKWFTVLLALVIPLFNTFVWGRRSLTIMLLLIIFGAGYFIKRWRLKPIVTSTGFILILFILTVAPQYRDLIAQGKFEKISEIDVGNEIYSQTVGSVENEYYILVYMTALPDFCISDYAYGTDIWNNFVRFWVPRQFLGASLKETLRMENSQIVKRVEQVFDYNQQIGMFLTGPADAFIQFGYLGCVFYFFIGLLSRKLWNSTQKEGSDILQIFYIYMQYVLTYAIVASVTGAFSIYLGNILVLGSLLYFSTIRKPASLTPQFENNYRDYVLYREK
jgi:oligosaccharide repeat unit polymerase